MSRKHKLEYGSGVTFKVISSSLRSFPEEVGKGEKKRLLERDSSHFGIGSFLPKLMYKKTHIHIIIYLLKVNIIKQQIKSII